MSATINDIHFLANTYRRIEDHSKNWFELLYHDLFPNSISSLQYEKKLRNLKCEIESQSSCALNVLEALAKENFKSFEYSVSESLKFIADTIENFKAKRRTSRIRPLYPRDEMIKSLEELYEKLEDMKILKKDTSKFSEDEILKLIMLEDKDFLEKSGISDYMQKEIYNMVNKQLRDNPELLIQNTNLDQYIKEGQEVNVAQLVHFLTLIKFIDLLQNNSNGSKKSNAKVGELLFEIFGRGRTKSTFAKSIGDSLLIDNIEDQLNDHFKKIYRNFQYLSI